MTEAKTIKQLKKQPKYELGQILFFLPSHAPEAVSAKVIKIKKNKPNKNGVILPNSDNSPYYYIMEKHLNTRIPEEHLYETFEDLLKSL